MSPVPGFEVFIFRDDISTVIALLEGPTSTVDGGRQDDEGDKHDAGTNRTSNFGVVEEGTNNGSGADLSEPVQETHQGTSTGVKECCVDGVLLVCVEPIRGPHHGEQQDDVWLGKDASVQTLEFGPPAGVLHENDLCTVRTDDLVGIDEEKSQESAGNHEDDESNVSTVGDRGGHLDVDVLTEGNQTTETTTDVEDTPEPSPVATFLGFSWVGNHDDTLGSPQDTGANTEESAGENVEAGDMVMNGSEQRTGVDGVTETTETDGVTNTETVDNGTSQETHHGKGRVEGGVLQLVRIWGI